MTFKKAANIVKKIKGERKEEENKISNFFLVFLLQLFLIVSLGFFFFFFFGMKATYIYFLTEFFFCEFKKKVTVLRGQAWLFFMNF